MKRTCLLLIIPMIISCNSMNKRPAKNPDEDMPNTLSEKEVEEGWELLFDGKTPDAWRGFRMAEIPDNWVVRDECLVTLGKAGDLGGDIISREMYEDFELSLDWAIAEGGNSGVFFHVLENAYPTVYATGPEYQLLDDAGYPHPLEAWQLAAANYAMHTADTAKKILKPAGEFNHTRIKVENGHVEHWLNGQKVLAYELWTDDWKNRVKDSKWKDYPAYGLARKGFIGLQDHGDVVRFRDIKIRDLTPMGEALFNNENLEGWKIHGTEKWYIDQGELVCESGPDKKYGYLSTEKNYDDFILRLKFKQESDGNSGVFFRSVLNGTDIKGWQVEVAPEGKDSGGIYESGGRGWLVQIPEQRENILKPGQWNDLVVLVKTNRVMVWLNQELMTDLEDEQIGKGKGVIALQIHAGDDVKVRWKEVFIKEL